LDHSENALAVPLARIDPHLAEVVAAWPNLPEHVEQTILSAGERVGGSDSLAKVDLVLALSTTPYRLTTVSNGDCGQMLTVQAGSLFEAFFALFSVRRASYPPSR
jgi:hypothetical protein